MNDKIKKCEKCGDTLKQSGPYPFKKEEGIPSNNKLMKINYWCMNETCEMLNKNIKIIPD